MKKTTLSKIAGAALDVFVTEPAKESPLFGTPNFICTPHLGASTTEAQVNVAIQVAEQISDFLLTGGVTNALNMPSLSAEEAPKLKPFVALAEKLGQFAGQVADGGLSEVELPVCPCRSAGRGGHCLAGIAGARVALHRASRRR